MNSAKIDKGLTAQMQAQPSGKALPVIVQYRSRETVRSIRAERRVRLAAVEPSLDLRPSRSYELVPAVAVAASSQAVDALSQDPEVERVWPDLPVHTMLDVSVPIIQAPRVWDTGHTGVGVKLAVVDTGIDPDHPDLTGRVQAMVDFSGEGPEDNNGHGTHVASIAAGNGAGSDQKYRGVAPEAGILAAKVLRGDGTGRMSDVMAGVEWAVDQGAQVINLSLGSDGPCDGTDALSVTVDAAADQGIVVCVAAGNAGPRESTVGSPGCARKVITVGASVSDRATDWDTVADFSSRGPTSDGRVKPDLSLPGVNIVAARAQGTSMGRVVDADYTEASGTSMATPHCAGVVALVLQAHPDLTPEEVKNRLMQTARDMGLRSNIQGQGRGDAYQALINEPGEPLPPSPEPPPDDRDGCLGAIRSLLRSS